jgi:hypothetical protein
MCIHSAAAGGPRGPVDVAGVLGAGALGSWSLSARPWTLRWCDGAVEVRGDPGRGLSVSDPGHRRLRLACGAAIANVRLAIRAQGHRAHLRLLPDPDDPWFLGRVTIGAPCAATPAETDLAEAIPRRLTDGSVLSGRPPDPGVREEIRRAAQREHSWAVFLEDGRDDQRPAVGTDDPALLVLATTLDQPLAHLQAGQALQHVLLLATVRGLAGAFVAPPLEVADTRTELRRELGGALWPQAMVRLGARERDAVLTERR